MELGCWSAGPQGGSGLGDPGRTQGPRADSGTFGGTAAPHVPGHRQPSGPGPVAGSCYSFGHSGNRHSPHGHCDETAQEVVGNGGPRPPGLRVLTPTGVSAGPGWLSPVSPQNCPWTPRPAASPHPCCPTRSAASRPLRRLGCPHANSSIPRSFIYVGACFCAGNDGAAALDLSGVWPGRSQVVISPAISLRPRRCHFQFASGPSCPRYYSGIARERCPCNSGFRELLECLICIWGGVCSLFLPITPAKLGWINCV